MSRVTPGAPGQTTTIPSGTQDVNLVKVGGNALALGQALAASSIPVVLTATQLTTLTPPTSVGITGSVAITAASLPLPTLASTSTLQTTGNTSLSSIDGKTPALGQALAAASVPVVLTAAQITTLTPPAALTNYALESGGNLSTIAGAITATVLQGNVKQINGITPLMGNGVTGTGSIRVTIASDNTTFPVSATLSAETTKVIGTVNQGTSPWVVSLSSTTITGNVAITAAALPLPSGASTSSLQTTGNTSLGNIDTNAGATTDAAVSSDTTGTLSGKIRGIVKILSDIWDSTNHQIAVKWKDVFGSATTFTITLASLASSTAGVGRQSNLITGNTAKSAFIAVKFTAGTTPTANSLVYVYLIRGDGTITDDNAGSSDAGITVINAPLLGAILISAATSNATYYGFFDTKFLGSLGSNFAIAIVNSSGATANATGGNFAAEYTFIT